MLKEIKNGNYVRIEGLLSEMDLTVKQITKDPANPYTAITGNFIVRADIDINGEIQSNYIKVDVFAKEFTNANKPNPAFAQFKELIDKGVSIAVGGEAGATAVRVNGARMTSNDYYDKKGVLRSGTRITASFVDIVSRDIMKPTATFSAVFMVGSKGYITDADGVETDTYKVTGMLPRYNGTVDVIEFVATNPNAIDAISSYWSEGDTVKAEGRIVSTMEEVVSGNADTAEAFFGEAPATRTYTRINRSFVITRGTPNPLEGEFAIDYDDMKEALAKRKAYLESLKDKAAPAPAPAKKPNFADLGF